MTTIGATTATKTQITKTIAQGGGRVERYEGTLAAVDTYIATLTLRTSSSDGFPLESINVQHRGGKATATMTYKNWNVEVTAPPGTVFRNSDGAAQNLPITRHPKYNKAASDVAGEPMIEVGAGYVEKTGVETYMVPSIVYSRTNIVSSFTFSQSNLTANVGTRNSPTGMTGASAGKWLKTGIQVAENDDGAVVTETWLYAEAGWDVDIYS